MAGRSVVCTLLLVLSSLTLSTQHLICWQAILRCQREQDCSYAYRQYTEACSSVLLRSQEAAPRRRCPSHCISSLIQLNYTKAGPALEECDCAMDDACKATKRAIEPCMPRAGGVMGCMEARRLCESDRRCHTSLSRYLTQCGRLFNGVRCTDECRAVIEDMMQVPKALLLNDCVCDGMERPICESIKENMARLCFGSDLHNGGPASSGGSDYEYDDEEYDEEAGPGREGSHEEDTYRVISEPSHGTQDTALSAPLLLTLGTSLLLRLLLLG